MAKPSAPGKYSLRMTRLLKWSAIVTIPLLVLAAIAYWLIIPNIAEKLVHQQLERAGTRLGVEITTGHIHTSGWQGVIINDLKVTLPDSNQPLATIREVRASLDKAQILVGDKAISSVNLTDAEFHLIRMADGSLNVDYFRSLIKNNDSDTSDGAEAKNAEDNTDQPGFLRYFGGKWPDVDIVRASLIFGHEDETRPAAPWPLEKIHTEAAHLNGSRASADFTTTLELLASDTQLAGTKLPESVDIELTLRTPWKKSTGQLDFHPPIQVSQLGPLPFISAGIGGLSLDHDARIEARNLSVGIEHNSLKTNILDIPRASAQLAELSTDIHTLRILELIVDSPAVSMAFAQNGTNTLETIKELVRPSATNTILTTARRTALDIATKNRLSADPQDTPPADASDDNASSTSNTLANINWPKFLSEKAPGKVQITNATLNVQENRRPSHITQPAAQISLTQGQLELNHRPLSSELNMKASFQAQTNINPASGTADISLTSNYRSGKLEAHADIQSLNLSWLSQLLPSRFSEKIHGGTASFKLDVDQKSRETKATFSGNVALDKTQLFLSPLAEEPLPNINASYEFAGHYDPRAPVPELTLGRRNAAQQNTQANTPLPDLLDEDGEQVSQRSAVPTRGAIVFTTGKARLESVKADVLPSIYGIDWPPRLPARLDLQVKLPQTPLASLVEAVPAPIQGVLLGVKLAGTMSWDFKIEIPLHDARTMVWETKPVLNGFEIVHLPPAVDVFKLTEEFSHTITDEFERTIKGRTETVEFSRKITIPAMKPTPAEWLVENTPLTLEQIDRERRQRDWPHVPHSHEVNIPAHILNSPEYWLTDHATRQAAKLPWKKRVAAQPQPSVANQFARFFGNPSTDDTTEEPESTFELSEPEVLVRGEINSPNPYGPYQFVPLHHISPWLIRAIITTEDNSFFTHHGFNWLAIKESVHANLRAGRYVRGASTISMQLAKNLFLDRSKVLSRKLQEAFIVWLMEDVADIPKERLMEIYLNIIEFGPGVFGIHDASVHYFGKRPDELSLSEVIWLVSIVPSPKRHHAIYERGEITEAWFRRMTRYMRVMHARERVTEQQYLSAIEDRPLFYKAQPGAPLLQPRVAPPMMPAPDSPVTDSSDSESPVPTAPADESFLRQFKLPEFSP